MPTPACLATAEIGASGSARNTARAESRMRSSLRAACARRPLSGAVACSLMAFQNSGTKYSVQVGQGTCLRKASSVERRSIRPMCARAARFIIQNRMFRSTTKESLMSTTADRWRWLAFAAALAATLMDLMDSTIANVAAPYIRNDLGGSYADVQWISAAYTLAMAVMLLTGGRLGDMFGRKRMLLVGAAGFTLASVACAAAPSIEALVAFRVLQGGLGAVMVPQVFGLIRDLFPPREIGKAFGILGPACGLSAILGPVVSGLLIDADLFGSGWRMIFLVNVPVGVFVLIAGARFLPSVAPSATSRRLDVTSVSLAAVGAFMLVYPLVQGRELAWPAWVQALLVASVAVLAAFAWRQVRRQRA